MEDGITKTLARSADFAGHPKWINGFVVRTEKWRPHRDLNHMAEIEAAMTDTQRQTYWSKVSAEYETDAEALSAPASLRFKIAMDVIGNG